MCGKEPVACSRVPVPVGLTNVTAISAGFRFSLALSGGQASAWGANEIGQLGNGTTTNSSVPLPVAGLSEVTAIAAGEKHSLALIQQSGPAPSIELAAGVGSLTVNWKGGGLTEPWSVSWRPVAHPALEWAPNVNLPPTTLSYTISGLSARAYEVQVRYKALGRKIFIGTPLG
jgi:hypothetical protein